MNFHKIRTILLTALVSVCSLGIVQAQSVSVNNVSCPAATVTLGAGTIAINTAGCGGTVVTPTAPSITSGAPPASGSMGAAYSFQFAASGTTPITWLVTTGALPTGLSLSSAGAVSGTPTATGTFTFAVTASNSTAPAAVSPTYTVVITNLPAITSTIPAAATVNVVYSHPFIASQAITTWWVSAGTTPPGLTLNTSGVLSGTPNVIGNSTFTISAMNANGTATQNVNLSVIALTAPTITSFTPPAGTQNVAYPSFSFGASGSTPITWTLNTGTLPPGLNLAMNGALSGTPTAVGTSMFTVKAANGTMPDAISPQISLTINAMSASTGAVTADIGGNVIPTPVSRAAKAVLAPHPGLNGGSTISGQEWRGWAPDPARCSGTPAITRYWYHNIDLLDYGRQNALDYLDFTPNQAVTFAFVPATPTVNNSQVGKIFITTGPNATPASTFLTISTSPCDFDVSKVAAADPCYKTGASENGMIFQITTNSTSPVCKLTPGVQYYMNLRFQDARPAPAGAPTADACASLLPTGYSTCGALLQIQTY